MPTPEKVVERDRDWEQQVYTADRNIQFHIDVLKMSWAKPPGSEDQSPARRATPKAAKRRPPFKRGKR